MRHESRRVSDHPEAALELDPVADVHAARRALEALDAAETQVGVPLVDEAERHRLEGAADGRWPARWAGVLALRGGRLVGYGAARLTGEDGQDPAATGDVAAFPGPDRWTEVLVRLAVEVHGAVSRLLDPSPHPPPRLRIWVRHVDLDDLAAVRAAGFALDRRLGVLGRRLDDPVDVPSVPAGVTVRGARPGDDDEGIVAVLAAAYEGTGDGGWDLDRLRERYALAWFRPHDLLVAVDADAVDGVIVGLSWLKRRDAATGEVYNLAVHPRAQGRGLGPFLLAAGLEHLRSAGYDDVLLWVDLANERAVEVYRSQGFGTRWEDVALGRDLADSQH